jgi:hypothetical protein
MADTNMLLAIFEDLDPAAEAVDRLRQLGVPDEQMTVISGTPVTERMLGRPAKWTNVPRLAMAGALAGFLMGLFLAAGTPLMYPTVVGGHPLIAVPPSVVVLFEMTMLGLLISTFLGVFLDSRFPSYTPMEYVPEISDGRIAILFRCPEGEQARLTKAMTALGAEAVKPAEARQL